MEKQMRSLVLVPYPLQGHLTPMLQLGTLLRANGFSITIIQYSKFNSPNIPNNHSDLTFLSITEAFDLDDASTMSLAEMTSSLNIKCKVPLQNVIAEMMEKGKEDDQKFPCIIYDGAMYCVDAVAYELELPSIILRTTNASAFLTYFSFPQLHKDGYLPLKDAMSEALVPGLEPLRFKDLTIVNMNNLEISLQQMARTTDVRSLAVIFNSIDCLEVEQSSLAQLLQKCKVPVFPIGPLHTLVPDKSTSLLREDRSCMEWLDKQNQNSVLYVSLGSIASMNQNELREMAKGLATSRQPFLWVVRQASVLPEDFNGIVVEKGLIVEWAPQKEVLAHKSVGGFWSHCGRNSTLESICAGVAMICQPRLGDQMVNARLICHVWKVGIEMEKSLTSEEIENAIRRLMLAAEGQELRSRVICLKEKIDICVQKVEGASSCNRFSELTNFILHC